MFSRKLFSCIAFPRLASRKSVGDMRHFHRVSCLSGCLTILRPLFRLGLEINVLDTKAKRSMFEGFLNFLTVSKWRPFGRGFHSYDETPRPIVMMFGMVQWRNDTCVRNIYLPSFSKWRVFFQSFSQSRSNALTDSNEFWITVFT